MTMFEFDPNKTYMMPCHFDDWSLDPRSSGWYHDVTAMVVAYLTDREMVQKYLPAPFELDEEPIITVASVMNRDIDWLAGWGYNLVTVNLSAVYKSEDQPIHAPYCLVMWENMTDPILSGRELLGVPKIYADIPDHQQIGGAWYTRASHFGNKIMDMSIEGLTRLPDENLKEINQAGKESALFGWKYFPATGQPGASVSHPTLFPSESITKEAWMGKGKIQWQHLTWEQNPTQFHIVNAIADLPILEMRLALISRGSANLFVPDRLPRPLAKGDPA
jgi:acetoacetate decarboxylase